MLLFSGCVGQADDVATYLEAKTATGLSSTIAHRERQNDLQLRAAEAYLCRAVSIGAVARRYADPAVRMMFEQYCGEAGRLP